MDLTKSQNPDSMVLGSAKIELSRTDITIDKAAKTWDFQNLVDLGLARGVKIAFSSSKIDVKADNGTVPLKGQTDLKARVEFSLLERHIPIMGMIMAGIVSVKTVPGSKKSKTDTYAENSLEKDKLYEFLHANYDGSKPENIVIKQGAKTLTETTDYTIEQASSGAWGYKFTQGGQFNPAKAVTAEFEITEIKSFQMSRGSGGVVAPVSLRLTNKRKTQDGRLVARKWEFAYGFYDGEDSISFKSKNDTDSVAEVPVAFEFSPHPDLVLDPEFENISLYKENHEA